MTVAELIVLLQSFPPDMEVLFQQFSDLARLTPEMIETGKAVDKGQYVEAVRGWGHKVGEVESAKDYLILPGN